MNKMQKRLLSGLLAALMPMSMLAAVPAQAKENDKIPGLILWYDFNDEVKDVSGSGNDGVNHGAEFDNGEALFNGESAYISMPNGILKDADSATVSATFRNAGEDNAYKWLWGIGDGIDNNIYLDPCVPWGSAIAATKINGGAESQIVYDKGFRQSAEYVTVTVVINGDNSAMYLNGERIASGKFGVKPSDLGNTPLNYIGKSFWGGDALFRGAVSDFKIYDRALSDGGAAYDYILSWDDDEKALEYLKNRAVPAAINHVTTDLKLITADPEKDGFGLSWKSLSPEYISDDGTLVSRPETGEATANLQMKLTYKGEEHMFEIPAVIAGKDQADYIFNVENKKDNDIQKTMWGLFFEDISRAVDGGLYAEMLYNRSFENMRTISGYAEEAYEKEPGFRWLSADGKMTYLQDEPLNENNKTYLHFTGTSFENQAYDGIYLEDGKEYNVSLYAKSDSYKGGVTVSVIDEKGKVKAEGKVTESVNGEWTKYSCTIKAKSDTRGARFIVTLDNEAAVDFDMISMMPADALFGVFRNDLVDMLKEMKPGFMRFPGGCIVEGYNEANHYRWKDSVGAVEERKENLNRWAIDQWQDEKKRYNQSYGIGYYEYMLLCEYLECEAVPVLPVGIGCQYQAGDTIPIYEADGFTYSEGFKELLDDAVDLIDFANSVDFDNNEWARLRRDMGHAEPFNLTMVAIGNEQWETDKVNFFERYTEFEKYVHAVYPEIKLLGTAGPAAGGDGFDRAWEFVRNGEPTNGAEDFSYAVDEHYYCEPDWFLNNVHRYDDYDRKVKVFAGEYASRVGDDANTLHTALTEAAYMTGLERNSDVVYMCSYAPLFARVGWENWGPNLIWFDEADVYGTPDYYEQLMYSRNRGDYTLENTLESLKTDELYSTAAYDEKSGEIIVKLVNVTDIPMNVKLNFDGFETAGTAKEIKLTHDDIYAKNSIENPENCVPEESKIKLSGGDIYTLTGNSFVVLRVQTASSPVIETKDSSGRAPLYIGLAAGAAAVAAGAVALAAAKSKKKNKK